MLILTSKANNFGALDGSAILPDQLNSLSLRELQELQIDTDAGPKHLEELFQISIAECTQETAVLLVGDFRHVHSLGAGISNGTLVVLGDIGDRAGFGMVGGRVLVVGDAGDQLAAAMQGGLVYVSGNCGDNLGAPLPGKRSGLRGGDIFICGSVGTRACERMRRGTVFVAGSVGPFAAAQMLAGTIVVAGSLGAHWGGGMRRGSLVLMDDPKVDCAALLSEAREFELSFLPLVWKHLARIQLETLDMLNLVLALAAGHIQPPIRHVPNTVAIPTTRWVQRQIADLNVSGKGEVLVLRRMTSLGIGRATSI